MPKTKVQIFYKNPSNTFSEYQFDINVWLIQNSNIEIISTNVIGSAYIILYKEQESMDALNEVD